jgi:hypothetical protein
MRPVALRRFAHLLQKTTTWANPCEPAARTPPPAPDDCAGIVWHAFATGVALSAAGAEESRRDKRRPTPALAGAISAFDFRSFCASDHGGHTSAQRSRRSSSLKRASLS